MRVSTFLKPLSFIPALLLMYMIYSFSAQEGEVSSSLSYKVSYRIVQTADRVFDVGLNETQLSNWAVRINGVTRKIAHMGEYFLLAVAVSFPLYVYGVRGFLLMIVAGMICLAYAAGDEYHQTFVTDRSGQLKDVGIDSIGIFFGILLTRAVGWTSRKTVFREADEAEQARRARKRLKKERRRLEEESQRYASAERTYESRRARSDRRYYEEDLSAQRYDRRPEERYGSYEADDRHSNSYGSHYENYDYRRDEEYERREDRPQPEESSDELSDDMPLSRLFTKKPKK